MAIEVIPPSRQAGSLSEAEIQSAFEVDYSRLESGLSRIASFVGTGVGEIDSLAIDEEGNPVIVEFKREGGSAYNALIQAADYAVWCKESFSWLEKIVRNAGYTGNISRDIRIIIVAAEFDERIKRAARGLVFSVQLVSFYNYDRADDTLILPRIEADTSASRVADEPPPPKTKEQHFIGLSQEILDLYERFETKVRGFSDFSINYQPQGYIGIRYRGQNLVGVHPKREWIRLDVKLTPEQAQIEGFKGMQNGWGYFHLTNESFESGLQLVQRAREVLSRPD